MKNKFILLKISILCCFLGYSQPSHNKKVVGYYAQWAIYARDYNISKIDGNKLTHLNYAFFDVDYNSASPQNTKLKSIDTYADFDHNEMNIPWDSPLKGNFYELKTLKTKYPHLKILISVGGWTKSQKLPAVAANVAARTALANDMANFLVTYPFLDGFDIDWEYPVKGGTDGSETVNQTTVPAQPHTVDDHKNFVLLVKAMRQAMPNKLITIAAGNNVNDVVQQYIGPNNRPAGMTDDLTTYCDYITFFGYDFGGNWNDITCYNAPLYGSGNTNDPLHNATRPQSVSKLVDIFLNEIGIPNDKLIMGLPFYGKLFNNVSSGVSSIPSLPGLFVAAPRNPKGACNNPIPPQGTWDTFLCEYSGSIEFCDLSGGVGTTPHHYLNPGMDTVNSTAASAGWVRYWDNTCKVPFLYNQTTHQFVSYDDKQSIDEKCKFILSKNLGGGMIWELSQDTRETNSAVLLTQVNTTFSNPLSANDYENIDKSVSVYLSSNQLTINSSENIEKVTVFSVLGKKIIDINSINNLSAVISNNAFNQKQVYIVIVTLQNGLAVTKKVVN